MCDVMTRLTIAKLSRLWLQVALLLSAGALGISQTLASEILDPPAESAQASAAEEKQPDGRTAEKESEAEETAKTVEVESGTGEVPAAADVEAKHLAADSSPEAAIRPRFELHVPSVAEGVRRVRSSRGGWFITQVSSVLMAKADDSVDGLRPEEIAAIVAQIAEWPDTSVKSYVFAPDLRGRPRWAVELNWPHKDLCDRTEKLLALPAVTRWVDGIRLRPAGDESFQLMAGAETLALLINRGEGRSIVASHAGLPVPEDVSIGLSPDEEGSPPPLLSARWRLAGTEQDTGATFFSSFNFITDVVYSGHIADDGGWAEKIEVRWPPLSGIGAKAVFSRVRQSFFVPKNAFGAVALNSAIAAGMVESMAGFGPQMVMSGPGQMEFIGQPGLGPIAANVDSELCFAAMPGTGFLPVPEFVAQARTRNADRLISSIRQANQRANAEYRQRDLPEPWREGEVLGRPFFWSDGGASYRGMIMPMVMRPVMFVSDERDSAGRDRRFLVLGWTSTSPEGFVRRWLQLPRTRDRVDVPGQGRTDGQAWINWKVLYRHIVPYVNLGMGSVVQGAMLPRTQQAEEHLSEAWVDARLGYTGLTLSHNGPVALGGGVLPLMAMSAAGADRSGSDLARERLATQRLEVFYHHAKLFHKDIGRWPAEVVELDGYVDFAGNRHLLRLDLSSRKKWSDFFTGIFDWSDDDDDSDEDAEELDDHVPVIDTKLFRITWVRDSATPGSGQAGDRPVKPGTAGWRLGLAPGTLDHLKDLYVDQNGVIHRIEKTPAADAAIGDNGEVKKPDADERASAIPADQNRDRYEAVSRSPADVAEGRVVLNP